MHCTPPSFWPAPQLDYRLPSDLVGAIDKMLATRLPIESPSWSATTFCSGVFTRSAPI